METGPSINPITISGIPRPRYMSGVRQTKSKGPIGQYSRS